MALLNQLVGIIALACAIWVIYDIFANQKNMKTLHKVLWVIGALFFSIITAIIYYFVYKNK
ncbi:hypothetical protein BVX95_01615 [archaeon D22]|nr:hypothetical protein BVX95_01615 [archaeon D22]